MLTHYLKGCEGGKRAVRIINEIIESVCGVLVYVNGNLFKIWAVAAYRAAACSRREGVGNLEIFERRTAVKCAFTYIGKTCKVKGFGYYYANKCGGVDNLNAVVADLCK